MQGCVAITLSIAEAMSAFVELTESEERRLVNATLFIVKSGESVKVVCVAFEMKAQAKFHVSVSFGDSPVDRRNASNLKR